MKKTIILFLALLLAVTSAYAGSEDYSMHVPEEALEYATEEDLVEIFCYEAKYQGGLAIATVEALEETLDSSLSKFNDLGIKVNLDAVTGKSQILRQKIEAICQAGTLVQAQERVREFKGEAMKMKGDLQNNLAAQLRADIEKQVKGAEEQIRAKFEQELRVEADQMVEDLEIKYEGEAQAEAEAEKQKLKAKIQAEVEAELMAEFGNVEDPDINHLMELGEQRGRARGEIEGKEVEERLRAKYEAIGEQERERLNKLFAERAEAKEKEIRELYGDFSNIKGDTEALAQRKMTGEWEKYQGMAEQAKLGIIEMAINVQFAEARKLIEAQRVAIELVHQENMQDEYNIPTVEELLEDLEKDRLEIIAMIAGGNHNCMEIENHFRQKWDKIRQRLELARTAAPGEVFRHIDSKADWAELAIQLKGHLQDMQQIQGEYNTGYTHCRQNPEIKTSGQDLNGCAQCRIILKESKDLVEVAKETEPKLKNALVLIESLEIMKASDLSLEAALAYKNELQTALVDLRGQEEKYKNSNLANSNALQREIEVCKYFK